jgi:hypothetical protein
MAPAGQIEPAARNESPVQNSGYEARVSEAPAPPPPLPEYSQPECPGENYMWTPGYWAYSTEGYYWTPGAWTAAPYIGALWTPPWWGYSGSNYIWHAGYWGPYVGFYGGIDYGFGYTGRGFYGGYWQDGAFKYNRTVTNVNPTVVRNVYERRVSNYTPVNRISYNGGRGGIDLRPVASEQIAMRARRMGPAPAQVQYEREAAANRGQLAALNGGRPDIAAVRPVAERETEPRGGGPAPNQPVQRAREFRKNRAAARETPRAPRPGFGPNRPAMAMREQKPSPFRLPAARPSAPQHREHSADRRMPEARPHLPAGESRPAQHQAPETRPPSPQGRPAPPAHPEPQRPDRDKQ